MNTIHFINNSPLIGDALASYPFMLHMARDNHVFVTGDLNPLVKDFVTTDRLVYDVPDFTPDKIQHLTPVYSYQASMSQSPRCNIAEGYFRYFHLDPPESFQLSLKETPVAEKADIVIAPFSRSDGNNFKRWPQPQWQRFIAYLASRYNVYILSGGDDDVSWALRHGAKSFHNRPLSDVYTLLKNARAVVTIDTGISHLCHFGAIKHHVLLYPLNLPQGFAESPYAVHIRQPSIHAITVNEVIKATEAFL